MAGYTHTKNCTIVEKRKWEDCTRISNIWLIGCSRREKRESRQGETIKQVTQINFQEVKDTNLHTERACQGPSTKSKNSLPGWHIFLKCRNARDKDKILELKEKKRKVTRKGQGVRKASDFLKAALKARREWDSVYKNLGVKRNLSNLEFCTQHYKSSVKVK